MSISLYNANDVKKKKTYLQIGRKRQTKNIMSKAKLSYKQTYVERQNIKNEIM